MSHEETLQVQRDRLSVLLTQLSFAGSQKAHDELIDRIRVAVADVRKTRELLTDRRATAARVGN